MPGLSEWLRRERQRCGMVQRELAALLGVNSGTVSRWERGQCLLSLDEFRMCCLVFGASADEALGLPARRSRRARAAAA